MKPEDQISDAPFTPLSPVAAEAIIAHSPTPNDPPWGVGAAVGLWIASVAAIIVVPLVFLLPYLATLKPPITDPQALGEFAKSDPTSIFLQIAAVLPAHILTLLIAWYIVSKGRRYRMLEMLGWQQGGFKWWHYIIILGAFFIVAGVVGQFFPEKENDLMRMLNSSRAALYIVAFVATFTAPFIEEVVYRGVLYSAFQRTLGIPAAFVISTLLFALVHVPQYWPSFSTIFLLTVLSLTLTSVRVKTGNLLPCVILHTLFNGIQSVVLLSGIANETRTTEHTATAIFHLLK